MFPNVDVLELLLDEDVDIAKEDVEKRNPVHYAAIQGAINCIEVLGTHGSFEDTLSKPDAHGLTPVEYSLVCNNIGAYNIMHDPYFDHLQEEGDDQLIINGFHCACYSASAEIISKWLPKVPASYQKCRFKYGWNLYHWACISPYSMNTSHIEELINKKAFLNLIATPGENGETPLIVTAKLGNVAACQLLVEHYSYDDLIKQTPNGHACFHFAAKTGNLEVFLILKSRFDRVKPQGESLTKLFGHSLTIELLQHKDVPIVPELEFDVNQQDTFNVSTIFDIFPLQRKATY
jgi:ankyrin repeat protein